MDGGKQRSCDDGLEEHFYGWDKEVLFATRQVNVCFKIQSIGVV
jgi:uncharacterized membrane protein